MSVVELHPEGNGAPIVGEWEGVGATYLIGRSGGLCWSPQIQPGDMPLAVFSATNNGVSVAPVHPLCHVSAAGQVVTPMKSGEAVQLGVEKYRLQIANSYFRRRRLVIALAASALIAAALLGGWYLRGTMDRPPAVASSDLYTF